MPILRFASLTIAEVVRRRVAWVLIALTLLSVLATTWGIERLLTLARQHGGNELEISVAVSQVLILVAFMFSFILAMTAAFLGAPAIAADLDSGVAHALLARPIRRADLVIGRWLGLVVVVVAYAVASGGLEIAAVLAVAGYAPPNATEAIAFLAAEAVVVLTLALALGTRIPAMASGAICVVLFGLGWMAGVFTGVGRFFDAAPLVAVADAVRWVLPTDGLWRGAIHGLEPPIIVLAALGRGGPAAQVNPFFVSQPPEAAFIAWSIAWVALVLGAAVISLERRDL